MSLFNKIFSLINQTRYFIYESILLKFIRLKKKNIYLKKDPLVEIILPTYNRSEMLKTRSIPSVLKQTYKNFRLIIIGDCCTDDSENIVKQFNDDRIFFYNLSERKKRYPETVENHWFAGPVVGINAALKIVKGDWIARIDDDDIWEEEHLEKLLNHAIKENVEFVSSSYTVILNGRKILKDFSRDHPAIGGVQTWLYTSYLKFFKSNINCWRKNTNKVNDLDLQDRMFRSGVKMSYLPDSTCFIMPRPNEKQIGLRAYKDKSNEILKEYKFQ